MSLQEGIFVVLEGMDRVGKSTQATMLADALSAIYGKDTYLIRFPDRSTTIGETLSSYLAGKVDINPHAAHLLFTANRWERALDIRAALQEGRCVVADRYSYSGIAYTASKDHPTDKPSWEWCLRSEEDLPQPDLVLCLLPASVDDLERRGGFGNERFENASFQSRVLENYRRLADHLESQARESEERVPVWRWVNVAKSSISEVHQLVMQEVTRAMVI